MKNEHRRSMEKAEKDHARRVTVWHWTLEDVREREADAALAEALELWLDGAIRRSARELAETARWLVDADEGCCSCCVEHQGVCLRSGERIPDGSHAGVVPQWCPLRKADIVVTLDTSGLGGEG